MVGDTDDMVGLRGGRRYVDRVDGRSDVVVGNIAGTIIEDDLERRCTGHAKDQCS